MRYVLYFYHVFNATNNEFHDFVMHNRISWLFANPFIGVCQSKEKIQDVLVDALSIGSLRVFSRIRAERKTKCMDSRIGSTVVTAIKSMRTSGVYSNGVYSKRVLVSVQIMN